MNAHIESPWVMADRVLRVMKPRSRLVIRDKENDGNDNQARFRGGVVSDCDLARVP